MKKIVLFLLVVAIMSTFSIAFAANRVSGSDIPEAEETTAPIATPATTTAPTTTTTPVPDPDFIVGGGSGIAGEPGDNPSSNPTSGHTDYTVDNDYTDYSIDVPDVSAKDLEDKLNDKGNDVISILQLVGRIVCIVVFVICGILAAVSFVGKNHTFWGSVLGMIISGVVFAAITCGPEIVQWISAWAIA